MKIRYFINLKRTNNTNYIICNDVNDDLYFIGQYETVFKTLFCFVYFMIKYIFYIQLYTFSKMFNDIPILKINLN